MKSLLVWFVVAAGALRQDVKPMAKDAKPVFEVAAIKRTDPAEKSQGFQTRGRRVVLVRESVASMMMFAYGMHHQQIVGAPAWVEDETYDVNGLPDVEGEPDSEQMQHMVRGLLVDRFGLKFHGDKRERSYFALTAVKGSKLTPAKDPDAPADDNGNGNGNHMTMKWTSNSMDEFRIGLLYFVNKPVVNQTGLTGKYDFALTWTPDEMKASEGDQAPGLFTAMREQLGLELKPAKGPVEVMVVDAVERPSAN